MKAKYCIAFAFLAFFLASCNEVTQIDNEDPVTDFQLEKSKLKEAALLITDLVKQPEVVKELKLAIDYSRTKMGRDEDIYFSELFSQEASYKNKIAQNLSGTFAAAFRNAVKKAKSQNISGDEGDLEAYLKENNMKLYWPYSENWEDNIMPTISYDPLDNEHENEGFKPLDKAKSKNNNSVGYETVLVNDDYAYHNPALLIVPCYEDYTALTCGGGGSGGSGSGGDGDTGGGGTSGEVAKKILIGEARLTKQMDGLFAGGSEIYWHGANAVLTSPTDKTPTLKAIGIKYSFSRKDIRKKRWKGIHSLFDQNWSDYEVSRQLLVIEGDGDPKFKNFGIKLNIPKVGGIGFELEHFEAGKNIDSNKTTLYNNYLERDLFLADNNGNDGFGLRSGLKIRHADHLYWTMKVTDINY